MLQHPPMNSHSPETHNTVVNGHQSHSSIDGLHTDSTRSGAPHGYAASPATSSDLRPPHTDPYPLSAEVGCVPTTSFAQDAEGSPDPEFAGPGPSQAMEAGDSALDSSAGSQSPRPGKRKAREDDENFMNNDPELYGLRRSVSYPLPFGLTRTDSAEGPRSKLSRRMFSRSPSKLRSRLTNF